jgi:hypothetical protein
MKAVLLAVPVLFMLLVGPTLAQHNEDLLKKRFLSEYPQAIKAWEARISISNLEGAVKYTEDDTRKKLTPHREIPFSFKCKLPDMMILTSIENNANGQRKQLVNGSNKNYSFALMKLGDSKDFVIKSLEAANGPDRAPKRSGTKQLLRPFLWVPYASLFPHDSLLSNQRFDPRFVVRRVSTVAHTGRSLLRVEFDILKAPPSETRTEAASNTVRYEGFFLVSPEEKWVLYEYERRMKTGNPRFLYKGAVEYQGTLDGFPIVRHATHETLKLPQCDVVETHSFEFLDFRIAVLPDQDFTLASFGIPEAVAQPAKVARSRGLGYWLLALATAALAAAVFFKMAASRRKTSFPS